MCDISDQAIEGDTLHWEASYVCPTEEDLFPINNYYSRDVILKSGSLRRAETPAIIYSVHPDGFMPEVISPDEVLSYVIYFQNPLPVPAYHIAIIDALPEEIDPNSISHPF